MTKFRAKKKCYLIYKDKLSVEQEIVEELKDTHLLIQEFKEGIEIDTKTNMPYGEDIYKTATVNGLLEVI